MSSTHFKRAYLRFISFVLLVFICLCIVSVIQHPVYAQDVKHLERERQRGLEMLKGTKDLITENYYDPAFHGVDLDARFKVAEEKMKQAESLGQIFGIIAQVVTELNDSHTFFIPPSRAVAVEYGWRMQMIGDEPFVVAVKTGSDAEAQGLKPGDKIISVDGFKPSRATMWKMQYNYNLLRPQPGITVVVQSPKQEPRKLSLKAEVVKTEREINLTEIRNLILDDEEDAKNLPIYYENADESVMIWKLRGFNLTEGTVDDMMKRVRKHKSLILDLRGNPGGYVKTLNRLVGYFFDKEIVIADVKQRKKTEQQKAKPRPDKFFSGKLVVLVDSESGSAAEAFARVIQLEKRGVVIGDVTAGAVMQATFHPGIIGDSTSTNITLFGVSVTNADIIMSDGKSLEHVGVTPDEVILPSATEMASKLDPVLSRAATLVGSSLNPMSAGGMFPLKWPRLPK